MSTKIDEDEDEEEREERLRMNKMQRKGVKNKIKDNSDDYDEEEGGGEYKNKIGSNMNIKIMKE